MYLTSTLRPFDGGVMELGLEYTDKMAIPPQQPAFVLSGYCITECTAVVCAFRPLAAQHLTVTLSSQALQTQFCDYRPYLRRAS
jgi:hypothetical protein